MSINTLPATRYRKNRMPPQTKKNTKKGEPKQVEIDYDQLTVRECLVWDRSEKGKQGRAKSAPGPAEDDGAFFMMKKGELGRPNNRGYEMPEAQYNRHPDDSGTAGEALRGWPRQRRIQEEEETLQQNTPPPPAPKKKNKKDKNKSKKPEPEEEVGDAYIGDLISHRYLNDFAKQRAIEMERERRRKEAKERAAEVPLWKKKTDIKGNKTSQLRSIAQSEKVNVDAKDLWQMPKFKDTAKPQLTTFRKGTRASGNGAEKRGLIASNGDVVPVCTCEDYTRDLDNHDGRAQYDQDLEDRYEHHPAMEDGRDPQF